MSSMWRSAVILPALLAAATSGSAQYSAPAARPPAYAYAASANTAAWLNNWRTLRQSSNYRFSDYAAFLIANPDWPDAAKMRRWAEKAMQPEENGATVLAFFTRDKPETGTGWARLADAYAATGRMAEALDAARNGWGSPDLSASDEQAIWARYGASFTRADHDRRVDALLFAKKPDDAARFITLATPTRQAAFGARVAMLRGDADADSRYQSVIGSVTGDAGLMMDRIRYLRAKGYDQSAQQLAARTHNFLYRPADPERFYEMLVILAGDAAEARQWGTAYQHCQPDRRRHSGRKVRCRPGLWRPRRIHDARVACRQRRARPDEPAGQCHRNVRSLCQRRPFAPGPDQGDVLGRAAPRSPPARSRPPIAISRAPPHTPSCSMASSPSSGSAETFRPRPRPCRNIRRRQSSAPRSTAARWCRRCASSASRVARAEQALFVRALSESLNTDADRNLGRRAWPAAQSPGPRRVDGAFGPHQGLDVLRSPGFPHFLKLGLGRACGRWRTASPARKVRSTHMPSATPARAG